MPGGSAESYRSLGPILEKIAAHVDGVPCCTYIGTDGAGHFVKMIHNGIEYADVQLIAEACDLLRRGAGLEPAAIADVFAEWNRGDLDSFLVEITAEVLRHVDTQTGKPFVDIVLDAAGMKGTGTWTVQTALGLGVPVSGIAERVHPRPVVRGDATGRRRRQSAGPEGNSLVAEPGAFVEDVRQALYASKIIAYAQGLDAIAAGAEEFGWDIDLGAVARIWRDGCIIRAKFLNRITDAFSAGRAPASLVLAPYFTEVLATVPAILAARPHHRDRRRHRHAGLLGRAGLLRRVALAAAARRDHPGATRLLRSAHLPAGRSGRHVPHPMVRRPHRGFGVMSRSDARRRRDDDHRRGQ